MNVLLADDEELARSRLRKLLAAYDDVTVVGEAGDGQEAIQQVAELRPDAVFLDIKMPGADGLEVVRSLGSRRPKIVFCTAFDEYAVEAFELHAVDYLLKPVTRSRLAVCIEHLRRIPAEEWDLAVERFAGSNAMGATRFLARCGDRYRVVGQSEVEYFGFEDGFTALHTAAERFAMDPTLNVLERRLDPHQFFRISRGIIVRLDAVLEVAPLVGGYGEDRLRNGRRFPVSRRRLRKLLEELEGRGPATPH